MKTMTAITAAVLVMAATGCETMEQKGYVKNEYGDWIKPGTPYFGDGKPIRMAPGAAPAFDGTVFTQAMAAQQQSPQPVIVVGPGSGTTVATQSSAGTVVSQFGGYRPIVAPRPYSYYGY